jgi:hypothetical protein
MIRVASSARRKVWVYVPLACLNLKLMLEAEQLQGGLAAHGRFGSLLRTKLSQPWIRDTLSKAGRAG